MPSVALGVTLAAAPSVQKESIAVLMGPAIKGVLKDREIVSSSILDGQRHRFYAGMWVNASVSRTRKILQDYALYAKIIPYVDKITLETPTKFWLEGGVLGFKLRSKVEFADLDFAITDGHLRGLKGAMILEPAPERGTLVYIHGERIADDWPPRFVLERGAEIVFGFTARKMRSEVEKKD